jgi:hypothetical protein
MGLQVREETFRYSAFPGSLATPLSGLLLLSLFHFVSHSGANGDVSSAGVALVLHLSAIGLVAVLSSGRRVLSLPLLRRSSTNLVATAGDEASVRLWLVAHLDSKWQPVSILTRSVSVSITLLMLVATMVFLVL